MQESVTRVAASLADKGRICIVRKLSLGESPVEALAEACGLSMANTSRHLHVLRQAGLVTGEKRGRHVFCRLATPQVLELLGLIEKLSERRLPGLDRRQENQETKPQAAAVPLHIDLESFYRLVRFGTEAILDVRPYDEYLEAHIAGARSVPMDGLSDWAARASKEKDVVVYSRNATCNLSERATHILQSLGFRVRRFAEGFARWQEQGLPIEQG